MSFQIGRDRVALEARPDRPAERELGASSHIRGHSGVAALSAALATPAGYIGAMGSRRTHNNRTARMKEEGVTDEELSRIASPIGLDIGARTPEETAVAIAAEIIASRTGHSGGRLSERSGPIHAPGQDTTDSLDAREATARNLSR